MPVLIEAAGDHYFDLRHIRQQGGEELVGMLLDKSELPVHLTWRLQVQKKLNCNAETSPVRVVDEPRKWAVHLKIKPGDNNTCHLCSLLMPDGFQGEKVYYQLGKASVELDRNWRNRLMESSNGTHPDTFAELFQRPPDDVPPAVAVPTPTAAEPTEDDRPRPSTELAIAAAVPLELVPPREPVSLVESIMPTAAPEQAEARPKSGVARGYLNDPEKMRLLLLAMHEVNETGDYPQDHWVELLSQRMDWQDANRHEVGGVLTGLVRRGFIERRFRGSKPYGYVLSPEGLRFIADLIDPALAPSRPTFSASSLASLSSTSAAAARTADDPASVIRLFGPIAKQFLEANGRLEEIARREDDLIAELDLLKQEREQICHILDDQQVQSVLASLARLVRPNAEG